MAIELIDSSNDDLRERFRKMSDEQLFKIGKTLVLLTTEQRIGHNPFVLQLKLARDEWRRRHPRT